jgi:hypothetical protein
MTERIREELDLLRTAYPDLEYREVGDTHWVRIPVYPVPEGWSHPEVEVCFQIPASPGQAPYAFRVRPGLQLVGGGQADRYTFPVSTPWGDDWGQYSWSPVAWVPKEDVSAGANMLKFARSFADRLREGREVARFVVPADLYGRFREELNARAEGAGFFLANYEHDARALRLLDWRVVPDSRFESRSEFHLVLRDEVRAEIIKWAWDMGASLVEAHSHRFGEAEFEPPRVLGGFNS